MMLQPLSESSRARRAALFTQQLERAQGVLHLGAHLGQEASSYAAKKKPVLWVEALPDISVRLEQNVAKYPDHRVLCALLSDSDGQETVFHVSNNWEGVSSSIFQFGPYGDGDHSLWPEIGLKMVGGLTLTTSRLDTLLSQHGVDAAVHDFWIVDLQGAELLALRGAGELLHSCRALSVETSLAPVYDGGVLWPELELWLRGAGFEPLWTPERTHDDVLFVRAEAVEKPVRDAFHNENYLRHNTSRMSHLSSLGLDLSGKRVLELGAGIGDLTPFFLERGCQVLATEGRGENLIVLGRRYAGNSQLRVRALDMDYPEPLGERFDIVFAYGLLYHLANPAGAIRHMADHCGGVLLLETCVSFGDAALPHFLPEPAGNYSQALYGKGCRPTRRWIWEELGRHLPYVYMTRAQPHHEQFPTDWSVDNKALLKRAVFVASRFPLDGNPELVDELVNRQDRLAPELHSGFE